MYMVDRLFCFFPLRLLYREEYEYRILLVILNVPLRTAIIRKIKSSTPPSKKKYLWDMNTDSNWFAVNFFFLHFFIFFCLYLLRRPTYYCRNPQE